MTVITIASPLVCLHLLLLLFFILITAVKVILLKYKLDLICSKSLTHSTVITKALARFSVRHLTSSLGTYFFLFSCPFAEAELEFFDHARLSLAQALVFLFSFAFNAFYLGIL